MWQLFVPPAMAAKPSALSRVAPGDSPSGPATKTPSAFGEKGFKLWLEFQQERGKAVSKDTWSLFIDFVRTIDAQYKEYDETGGSHQLWLARRGAKLTNSGVAVDD